MRCLVIALSFAFCLQSFSAADGPSPLPKALRVESSQSKQELWKQLSAKEQKLAYHLINAANAGRELLFFQTHRYSIFLRNWFSKVLSTDNLEDTKALLGDDGFNEFLVYVAKFMDQAGPYSPYNRKSVLTVVTKSQVEALFDLYDPGVSQEMREEILLLLTDPQYELKAKPEEATDKLEDTGGNLYDKGLTREQVAKATGKTYFPGLNCHVEKNWEDEVFCQVLTTRTSILAGRSLLAVQNHLRRAALYSSTALQKQQILDLIKYLETGKVEDFRNFNIDWVKDGASSKVDFMMGWVEVYEDYLNRIGSWESYVQIVDPQVSKKAQGLAGFAQYFENNMPYGAYKKIFPKDYAPPAIMAYYLQEVSGMHTAGYNLPNFDDIRRDVGAKNVIKLEAPGAGQDPEVKAMWEEVLSEFAEQSKVPQLLESRERVWQNVVLMHEIIGHGSGTYDTTKYPDQQDPVSLLGDLGSALEEQRADQTALVFAGDAKLVELGLAKDTADALRLRNLTYDFYVMDFLRRTSRQRNFSEAHQRGHWLLIKQLMDKKIVVWKSKDGSASTLKNQVLVVTDYDAFHQACVELLQELQRIKAERDEKALANLFAQDAPLKAIEEPWAQALIDRGRDLKINAGSIEQPWQVTADGKLQLLGGHSLESIAPYWGTFYGAR